MDTPTPLAGIGLDTATGAVWHGPVPATMAWDPVFQMFTAPAPDGARGATEDEMAALRALLAERHAESPKAYQPVYSQHGWGYLTKPTMRWACTSCRSTAIRIPFAPVIGPEGIVEGWIGKGTDCSCPTCGYTGKKAAMTQLSMYAYTDLTRARLDAYPALRERLHAYQP